MKSAAGRIRSLVMLKLFGRKLQRALLLKPCEGFERTCVEFDEGELEAAELVPEDVEEGHFAVTTVMGGEPKRFIVELKYLKNPAFLRLLEQAKEEYGFQQQGVLAVPCKPEELQKILEDGRISIH